MKKLWRKIKAHFSGWLEHAINCMDIAPVSMMAFERIALEHKVSLVGLLQTMLLNALDKELTKDKQLEFSFTDDHYG
jgi:hypothetical protein